MEKPVVIVLATKNQGKLKEMRNLLADFPVEFLSLDDFGPIPEVVEDGDTFDDNAYKKSSFTARVLGFPVISDDSGLIVEALGGAPGVYSARYAGENATDEENNRKLLAELDGKNNRAAAFECVISIAVPTGPALTYNGRCEGRIADELSGSNGFGYDPLFISSELGKCFAELSMEEKNSVSHRGKALNQVAREFDKILVWLEQNMPRFVKSECVT